MADQGNDLGRVNAGDPLELPARTFNIFCETAEAVRRMRGQFAAGPGEGRSINTGVVTVRNDSGGDRDRFDVLGIGAPIIDNTDNEAEFLNRVTFKGLLPDIDVHKGRFVVLLEPIADGALGKAVSSGVVQVRIDVGDADHQFADVTDDDATKLTSGDTGAEILWKEAGTGYALWAIVRLANAVGARIVPFEMYDDIAPGETEKDAWQLGEDLVRDEELDKVYVSDGILGDVRARGSNSTGNGGARGWYTPGANGENQIVSIQRQAKMCYCQAKIASGNTLTIVDHVVPMDGGQSPVDAAEDELAVTAGFETDDDACGIIAWDETNDAWRPLDFPCKT